MSFKDDVPRGDSFMHYQVEDAALSREEEEKCREAFKTFAKDTRPEHIRLDEMRIIMHMFGLEKSLD